MNKVIEYMALSLPVVSFDLVESRKSAGAAAIFVPNNDVDQMAKEMIQLLGDPERRERMGALGRDRVVNGLSWETSEKVYVNLYDELLRKTVSR